MKRTLVALAAAFALVVTATSVAAGNAAPKKGPSCCAEGEKATGAKCDPAAETAVALVGTVLCEHCDLHVAKSCNPVFKAEGREGYLPFCPGMKDVDAIKAAAEHGKVRLDVKGKVCKTKDGKEVLMVESFAKKA